MTAEPEDRTGSRLTRRRLLLGGASLAVAGGAAAAGAVSAGDSRGSSAPAPVALGRQPAGLPDQQYAWDATLPRDRDGNPLAPRHVRLLFFDVVGRPSVAHATVLEAALRSLERHYPWGPHGLLFTVGWGHRYFAHTLGVDAPIPPAKALSDFELPTIDDYDLVLHLASNDERTPAAVQAALTGQTPIRALRGTIDVTRALALRDVRTGFTGAGLPAAHQDIGGIPAGQPVPAGAPLFMGFRSSLRRNQAGEDAIAIPDGEFAGGTTMAVSYMRLALDSWYQDLDESERVARMFAPQLTPADVGAVTTDAPSEPQKLEQAIRHYGVIGHAQASARARRNGKPLILRRDVDTVDGGRAGVHFVSLQRTIADFVATRTAMNAAGAQLQNPAITDTVNNGINEFIFVMRRGNYLLPPRARRSFPSLSERA